TAEVWLWWSPSVAQLLPGEVDEDRLERGFGDREVGELGPVLVDGLEHGGQGARRPLHMHPELAVEVHDVGDDPAAVQSALDLGEIAGRPQSDDGVGLDAVFEALGG